MPTISAAIAAHNRRPTTLRAVRALLAQQSSQINIRIWIYDDGSSDGTGEALRGLNGVNVISGTGAAYWSGGMHVATTHAIRHDPDFILLLNDDVQLDGDAISRLHELAKHHPTAILVGSTRGSVGQTTYGGLIQGRFPLRFRMVTTPDEPQPIDTFNGNIAMIPREAWKRLGPIDATFVHNYGDLDYGLRARDAGIPIILGAGTYGACDANPAVGTYLDPSLGFVGRWRAFMGPKGRPWRPQLQFTKRHGGRLWPLHALGTYVKFAVRVVTRR